MKLAVSAIAWSLEHEVEAFEILKSEGVKFIECIPYRFLNSPSQYKENLDKFGLSPIACQALLFNTHGLHLFTTDAERESLSQHLKNVIIGASQVGAKSLVFGSPKNRWVDEKTLTPLHAHQISQKFFSELGDFALKYKTVICIETNPVTYGCNFLTKTLDTLNFVKEIGHKGIKFNLDLGAISINEENPFEILKDNKDFIGHVHISEPELASVSPNSQNFNHHLNLLNFLKEIKYNEFISIEMAKPRSDNWKDTLKKSILEVNKFYGLS